MIPCEEYKDVVSYAEELMHGKASEVTTNNNSKIFAGLAQKISVARYHSLIAFHSFNAGWNCRGIRNFLESINAER